MIDLLLPPDAFGWLLLGVVAAVATIWLVRAAGLHAGSLPALLFLAFAALGPLLFPVWVQRGDRWINVGAHFDLYLGSLLAAWLYSFSRRTAGRRVTLWPVAAALLAGSVLVAVSFIRPEWSLHAQGVLQADAIQPPRLHMLENVFEALVGAVAVLVLLRRRVGASPESLLAIGFSAWPISAAAEVVASLVVTRPDPSVLSAWIPWANMGMVVVAGIMLLAWRHRIFRTAALGIFSVQVLLTVIALVWPGASTAFLSSLIAPLGTLLVPIAMALVEVRHAQTGNEARVRGAIRRAVPAAAFVALFFGVSEWAAQSFATWLGSAGLGLVAASVLVFLLAPLQRFASRAGEVLAPDTSAATIDEERRLATYEQQVRFAWASGGLNRRERERLRHLREALGIGAEEALRIEDEVTA